MPQLSLIRWPLGRTIIYEKITRCPSCRVVINRIERVEVDAVWMADDGHRFSDGQQDCYCCPVCGAILAVSPSLLSDIEGYTCNIESGLGGLQSAVRELKQAVEKLGGAARRKKA